MQYLVVEAGVTQFIDLGSGLPTQGNVSEVAHQYNPDAHIVHVDYDPIVYTHSKALLADDRTTDFVIGDVRRPGEILADPVVRSLIDFDRPVGLLMFAILHHVEDADHPERIADEFRDAMPSGSYLAISSLRLPGPDLPELRAITIEGESPARGHARLRAMARGRATSCPGSATGRWSSLAWCRCLTGVPPSRIQSPSPRYSTASSAASPGRSDARRERANHAGA